MTTWESQKATYHASKTTDTAYYARARSITSLDFFVGLVVNATAERGRLGLIPRSCKKSIRNISGTAQSLEVSDSPVLASKARSAVDLSPIVTNNPCRPSIRRECCESVFNYTSAL